MYISDRIPSKYVSKTSFELWVRGKSSLKHFRVGGCPVEVKFITWQRASWTPKLIVVFSLVI